MADNAEIGGLDQSREDDERGRTAAPMGGGHDNPVRPGRVADRERSRSDDEATLASGGEGAHRGDLSDLCGGGEGAPRLSVGGDPQRAEIGGVDQSPFVDVPGGIDLARHFWHEVVMGDQPVPYRRGQYHGCDGINLWREGADYCYLWVEATVDHDMWMAYLLEIRTNIGGVESRDHLYLAAGAGDLFEVEWRNQPIRFDAPLDDHIDHHRAAMHWFVERDVGTIEERNGGDQGVIDRAAACVTSPASTPEENS